MPLPPERLTSWLFHQFVCLFTLYTLVYFLRFIFIFNKVCGVCTLVWVGIESPEARVTGSSDPRHECREFTEFPSRTVELLTTDHLSSPCQGVSAMYLMLSFLELRGILLPVICGYRHSL